MVIASQQLKQNYEAIIIVAITTVPLRTNS